MLNSSPFKLHSGRLVWLSLALSLTLSASCGGRQPQAESANTTQAVAASPSPIPWATIEPPTQVGAAVEPAKAEPPKGEPPKAKPSKGEPPTGVRTYSGVGVVRLINLTEGWLEIDHEEIKDLMPAMQMEWSVRDRSMLNSVSVGDRVEFKVEDNNGTEVITELKRTPPAH